MKMRTKFSFYCESKYGLLIFKINGQKLWDPKEIGEIVKGDQWMAYEELVRWRQTPRGNSWFATFRDTVGKPVINL